jgi:hypothetical protein
VRCGEVVRGGVRWGEADEASEASKAGAFLLLPHVACACAVLERRLACVVLDAQTELVELV